MTTFTTKKEKALREGKVTDENKPGKLIVLT
jgi:hypothetical protein